MTIAIVGSRIFDDYDLLKSVMQPFLSKTQQIVSGGAEGADKLGEKWSYDFLNQPPIIIRPQWRELNHPDALIKKDKNGQTFDARAGIRRNEQIVQQADIVIAFWDGQSKGTRHTINFSRKLGKTIKVINFRQNVQMALPF
ncbi:MAG: hypothetical protein ACPG19_07800 [Saprospiraceae bacterium]